MKNEANIERASQTRTAACAVDIYEGKDDTRVYADMPGVSKDALAVQVHNNELHISGKTTPLFAGDEPTELRRAFTLPPGIDAARVTAEIKDGVLVLSLPKAPELKPRKIDVRVA